MVKSFLSKTAESERTPRIEADLITRVLHSKTAELVRTLDADHTYVVALTATEVDALYSLVDLMRDAAFSQDDQDQADRIGCNRRRIINLINRVRYVYLGDAE